MDLNKAEARLLAARVRDLDTGCWLCFLGTDHEGYARIRVDERTVKVHRLAYQIFHGPIPDGMVVRRRCDVNNCWNPDHLVLGTRAESTRHTIARGRFSAGRRSLSWDLIREIRARPTERAWDLSQEFGVSTKTVYRIRNNRTRVEKDAA